MADANEANFITGVSVATRIDPRVIAAWIKQEGAYVPGGTGGFNYLNLRPYPGDRYSSVSSGNFEQFSNVNDAVFSTVRRLNQPFARPIIATAASSPSPRQQIAAIASTGWDAGHYGGPGGPNLLATFTSMFKQPDDKYLPPAQAASVGATVGSGSAADAGSVSGIPQGIAGAAGSAAQHIPGVKQTEGIISGISSIGDAVSWVFNNWTRVGEVLLGFVLVILGLIFASKQQTSIIAGTAARFAR